YGICSMIDYFMDEDEPEVYTALDVLVQCALTGYYEETDDGQPIDRDDMEETVKRFQDIRNGLPTTDESDRLNNAEDDSDNEEEKYMAKAHIESAGAPQIISLITEVKKKA